MKRIFLILLSLVMMGSITTSAVMAQTCSGMVQCAAWDGYNCDLSWENSKACDGPSCDASCDQGCEISNGCSGGTSTDPWTCFAAGTKVTMADPTSPTALLGARQKNIEDVKVGDKVVSQDEMGNKSVSTVTELDQPIRDHMCRVDFVEGHELNMTVEHPVMTTSGWKSITPSATAAENPELIVSSLAVGDQVVRAEGQPGEVKNISCWSAKTPAYNLILDGNVNTYFADGYLAHNKGSCTITLPNCPAGTTRNVSNVVGTSCYRFGTVCSVGTAWVTAGNCECGNVETCEWVDCPTRNNPDRRCQDCTSEYVCRSARYNRVECVPNCATTSPTAPALNSPADGANIPTTNVTLAWSTPTWGTACSGTRNFKVYVGTTNPPTTLYSTETELITTKTFTGVAGTTYYWYIAADNGQRTTNSLVRSFTILNSIQVRVFNDTENTCSQAIPWIPASLGALNIVFDGTVYPLGNDGTVQLTPAIGTYPMAVNIPASYICSMGGCGNCARNVTFPPITTQNFYLTSARGAWWQTEGAGVYAGGQVTSILPSSSSRLILAPTGGTAAALLTATADPNLGSLGSVSDSLWMAKTKYKGKSMNYNYFAAHMGVVRGQASDWSGNEIDLVSYPVTNDFGYKNGLGTIGSDIHVTSGQSYTVFVNGNLDIGANIVVDQGGFLAFIVNGNVIVSPAVDTLQGLYVMDDGFVTDSSSPAADSQLDVQGTVVAWGSFALSRDLGNSNATIPAEKFTYRPDLLTNMPDKMKMFAMQWQEVVAGSFE